MKFKSSTLYLLLNIPLLLLIAGGLWLGGGLSVSNHSVENLNTFNGAKLWIDALKHPLPMVLLQLVIILSCGRVLGSLFIRIGQQRVMGEITAGILLGPSLLGSLCPDLFHFLFPSSSLGNLQILSQLGLILFMFVVGMELDFDSLRRRLGQSFIISHSSIFLPFLLGVGFAYFSFASLGTAGSQFLAYALFMGIAMSITAFPVLARILKERNMMATPIGSMAIICAAINDVTAWCILPIVVAVAKAESMLGVAVTLSLTLLYIVVMIFAVKPILQRLNDRESGSQFSFLGIGILTLLISAWLAETIGIHALFGAFLAGAIMPSSGTIKHHMTERLEEVSVSLLLPVFFMLTGLRANIGSLSSYYWGVCCIIIALAIAGKLLGSAIPARLTGMSWRESLSIGILMNTRGLMELIVLNIGYDLGILRIEVFTMLVFMALVTTFMTAPLLQLVTPRETKQ